MRKNLNNGDHIAISSITKESFRKVMSEFYLVCGTLGGYESYIDLPKIDGFYIGLNGSLYVGPKDRFHGRELSLSDFLEDDGGPVSAQIKSVSDRSITEGGISLRDYFASHALAGILSQQGACSKDYADLNAETAYDNADAMIAARGVRS